MHMHKLFISLVAGGMLVAAGCADDGADGADGPAGRTGPQGLQGDKGDPGGPGLPGAVGEPGPKGEDGEDGADGEPGANGVDGTDGADGVDGIDAPCALEPALDAIVTGPLPTDFFVGIESDPIQLMVTDSDGTDVTADVDIRIAGSFAAVSWTDTPGELTLTPAADGGPFYFTVVATDGCTTTIGEVEVDAVEVFEARVAFIHVAAAVPSIDITASGSTDILASVDFEDATSFVSVGRPTFAADLLNPATGSVLATTPELSLAQGGWYTVIAHDDGAGAAAFTVLDDDRTLPVNAGDARLGLFHAAAGVGPVDVTADGAAVFTATAFGALSTEMPELDLSTPLPLDIDVDSDGAVDLVFELDASDVASDAVATVVAYLDAVGALQLLVRAVSPTGAVTQAGVTPTPAPPTQPANVLTTNTPATAVPDDTELGDAGNATDVITVTDCADVFAVRVGWDVDHARPDDLELHLTSPSGDAFLVADPPGTSAVTGETGDSGFLFHWTGLVGNGDWTLEAVDVASPNVGTLNAWTLELWCN